MNVELFIVSYRRDFPWLAYALRSIRKFATGFSGVTVLVPDSDTVELVELALKLWAPPVPFHLVVKGFSETPGKGFLDHMAQLLCADIYSSEPDFFLHFDSDQIFREPVTPQDYFMDGKPRILKEPYERLETVHPGRFYWKGVTERTLGFETPFETMCCPCQIYPRSIYRYVREHIEKLHAMPFRDYVLSQRNEFPQTFGEHNSIGAYALKFYPDVFHWIEVPRETRPRDKAVQFWSHRSPDKAQDIWIDGEQVSVVPEKLIAEILS